MLARVAVVTAILTLAVASSASAADLPKPIGSPGGIYTGTVKLDGLRCSKCKVRIVVSDDGLEIAPRSTVRLSRCYGVTPSIVLLTRIRADGTYSATREEEGTVYSLRGRVTKTRITGRGTTQCSKRRLTFTARRTSREKPTKDPVRCEVLGEFDSKAIWLSAHQGLGCGIAHDVARGRTAGLTCKPATGGKWEPQAQTYCARGASGEVEVVKLTNCTTSRMEDYGAANSAYVHATAAAGCGDAKAVGEFLIGCDEDCATPPLGYRCADDKSLHDATADGVLRCVTAADTRKLLVIAFYSSDVV